MESKSSFLSLFEKLEGLAGKLPGALQKPILQEVTRSRILFLRQRAPRFVLAGEAAASSAGLFNAIFGAPVAPFAREGATGGRRPPQAGRIFRTPGTGCCVCSTRGSPGRGSPCLRQPARRSPPKRRTFSCFSPLPGTVPDERRARARTPGISPRIGRAIHGQRPCVVGVVVDADESETATDDSNRPGHGASRLVARPKIARHLAPTVAVRTFIRFRLDGTFDPESDRRRHVDPNWWTPSSPNFPTRPGWKWRGFPGHGPRRPRSRRRLSNRSPLPAGRSARSRSPWLTCLSCSGFQLAMVAGIIYVSGREFSLKLATEFLGTMGINVGLGLAFREGARAAARAATKLLLPGVGNALSGLVAAGGTYAIGRAALAYYIEGMDLTQARELLKRSRRPDKGLFRLLDRRKNLPDDKDSR